MAGNGQSGSASDLTRRIILDRGLFLLKYDASAARPDFPIVTLESDFPSANPPELITAPGADPVLVAPGDAMVVRVAQECSLTVRVTARRPGGSLDATVKVERVGAISTAPAASISAPAAARRAQTELFAHVSRMGDVKAAAGEWIAGPSLPAQIEGVAVVWHNCPADVQLRYGVTFGSRPRRQTDLVEAGSFVGTRGRAMPLVGVNFELIGPGAGRFQIVARGVFLGSAVVTAEGNRINMAGPTGGEPLVGLAVEIVEWIGTPLGRDFKPTGALGNAHVAVMSGQPQLTAERSLPMAASMANDGTAVGTESNEKGSGSKRVRVFRSTKLSQELAT